MTETIVYRMGVAAVIYVAVGIVFSVPFLRLWAGKMDPLADAGSWGFRLAVLPATVALWPILLLKVCRRSGPPIDVEWPIHPASQRRLHGMAFIIIAIVLPPICGAALWSRSDNPESRVNFSPSPVAGAATIVRIDASKLPIHAEVSTGPERRELKMEVSQALGDPVVAVYWSPTAAPDGIGQDAVFLGSVWGPARLAFLLPQSDAPGVLTFIALAGDQRVLETLSLK